VTVEFYFSDANLPYDKYLFTLSRKDPEGWVSLDILSSFTRMRDFKAKLGVDRIASLMRNSELVAVNSGGDKIRRLKELVPQKDQYERSVYAKGFPEETPTLQAELEAWFAPFGQIASVRMRRDVNVKG
jgi:lupus La protein